MSFFCLNNAVCHRPPSWEVEMRVIRIGCSGRLLARSSFDFRIDTIRTKYSMTVWCLGLDYNPEVGGLNPARGNEHESLYFTHSGYKMYLNK